jgi:hypothetical protein
VPGADTVEGFFGNLKNPSSGNIQRGWCRVVGVVKTSILGACAVAATDISLLRSRSRRTGDVTDGLCAPEEPFYGFEELTREDLERSGAPPRLRLELPAATPERARLGAPLFAFRGGRRQLGP